MTPSNPLSATAVRMRRYRKNLRLRGCSIVESLIEAGRLDPMDAANPAAIGRATAAVLHDWHTFVGRNGVDPVRRGIDSHESESEEFP